MHQNNILLGTVTPKIMGALNANCSNWLKVRTSNLTGIPPVTVLSPSLLLRPLPPHLPPASSPYLIPEPFLSLLPLPPPIPLQFSSVPSHLLCPFPLRRPLPSSSTPPLLTYPYPSPLPAPFPSPFSSPSIFPSRSVLLMPLTLSSVPSILSFHSLLSYPVPLILPFPSPLLITSSLPITSSPNPSLLPQPFSLPITLPKLTHNLHIYSYANYLIILPMSQSKQETLKIPGAYIIFNILSYTLSELWPKMEFW